MKLIKSFFALLLCMSISLVACKKDPSGNKVGIDEGKIEMSDNDSTVKFTVIDIKTQILGDTTSLIIESVNADSTIYFFMGFENITNFGENDYLISDPQILTSTRVFAYLRSGTGVNLEKIEIPAGKIEILKYLQKSEVQGKFEFKIPDENDTTILKGSFYASYPLLDPNRLPDLPINPQTMEVSINSVKTLLNVRGAAIDTEGEKGYVINGTLGSDQFVTISFKYFVPKVNQVYKTGELVIIDNDPSTKADNDTGYVEASYFEKGAFYWADMKRGNGKFSVTKLSNSTIQGTFSFTGVDQKDPGKNANLNEGLFFTKF